MKKQLLRLLLCAGLLAGLFTVTALAADWTYDPTAQTLTYTLSSDTVVLKNVTDDGSGKLTIGSYQKFTGAALDLTGQITDSDGNTYAITALGGSAFHGCGTLTTVALPESLTSIETYAFYSCSDLATVDFSRCTNLTIIDMYAFSNCTSLAAVDLSGCTSLSTIEGYAFQACGLTTMDLSGCTNLSSIGQCTFTSCDVAIDGVVGGWLARLALDTVCCRNLFGLVTQIPFVHNIENCIIFQCDVEHF